MSCVPQKWVGARASSLGPSTFCWQHRHEARWFSSVPQVARLVTHTMHRRPFFYCAVVSVHLFCFRPVSSATKGTDSFEISSFMGDFRPSEGLTALHLRRFLEALLAFRRKQILNSHCAFLQLMPHDLMGFSKKNPCSIF